MTAVCPGGAIGPGQYLAELRADLLKMQAAAIATQPDASRSRSTQDDDPLPHDDTAYDHRDAQAEHHDS